MPYLTKSLYMTGLQCLKYMWVSANRPEMLPPYDACTKHSFREGVEVGRLAKKLYPNGRNVAFSPTEVNLKRTREMMCQASLFGAGEEKVPKPAVAKKEGTGGQASLFGAGEEMGAEAKGPDANGLTPLFEAGFLHNSSYARTDIIEPAGDGWNLIEVKKSASVKDENLHDVAFQRYVMERAGVKVNKCFLMHINSAYVKRGDIDPHGLFIIEDVSAEVEGMAREVEENIKKMLDALNSPEMPEEDIGGHCSRPRECMLKEMCWSRLPGDNIFTLYRGGKKSCELYSNGTASIGEIGDDIKLTDKQEIQKKCARGNMVHVDKEGIRKFLDGLAYPLHYLDFETFGTAIPIYEGTRPYQPIPFQFSLHISDKKNVRHISYLANGKGDPRPEFIRRLKDALGGKGSIVVYNKGFEIARMRELAAEYPEYGEWVESVVGRIVDLLEPFRNFYYYNPKQNGSASIKSVMPALTGKGYSDLGIQDGVLAGVQFLTLTFGDAGPKDAAQIRKDLEEYCGRDTEGMIWIVNELERIVE